MPMRMLWAAVLALVAVDANAASFAIKNCSGASISVYGYDGTDTILAIPYNRDAIVIAHGQLGRVACDGIRCKVKVIYANGFNPDWASVSYSYDSCARYPNVLLTTFSDCIC